MVLQMHFLSSSSFTPQTFGSHKTSQHSMDRGSVLKQERIHSAGPMVYSTVPPPPPKKKKKKRTPLPTSGRTRRRRRSMMYSSFSTQTGRLCSAQVGGVEMEKEKEKEKEKMSI